MCSIVALALIIERFLFLRSKRIHPAKLLDEAMSISRPTLPSSETIKHMEISSILGSVLVTGAATP
jgi:biopolymer transport protein ExbB